MNGVDSQLREIKEFLQSLTPREEFLYIIQPCSIGDFLMVGGLAHAVQKRKNKIASVIIVNERMKNLNISYDEVAEVVYLPTSTMEALKYYFYSSADYEGDNYIYGHFRIKGGDFDWDTNLNFIDRYKKNVLHVPLDTLYFAPTVETLTDSEIMEVMNNYCIDKERTIILVPYTNSTKQFGMDFWETMVNCLSQRGFICYTNVDGISEQPIKGAQAISMDFRGVNFISDKVNCFIGGRNGFFDFLAMTKARIFDINPFPKWLWDLKLMYPSCNCLTFYDASDYVKPIAEYLSRECVGATMKLSHEHIDAKNIIYYPDELLQKIVSSV